MSRAAMKTVSGDDRGDASADLDDRQEVSTDTVDRGEASTGVSKNRRET